MIRYTIVPRHIIDATSDWVQTRRQKDVCILIKSYKNMLIMWMREEVRDINCLKRSRYNFRYVVVIIIKGKFVKLPQNIFQKIKFFVKSNLFTKL